MLLSWETNRICARDNKYLLNEKVEDREKWMAFKNQDESHPPHLLVQLRCPPLSPAGQEGTSSCTRACLRLSSPPARRSARRVLHHLLDTLASCRSFQIRLRHHSPLLAGAVLSREFHLNLMWRFSWVRQSPCRAGPTFLIAPRPLWGQALRALLIFVVPARPPTLPPGQPQILMGRGGVGDEIRRAPRSDSEHYPRSCRTN